jgi:hypothetical protein
MRQDTPGRPWLPSQGGDTCSKPAGTTRKSRSSGGVRTADHSVASTCLPSRRFASTNSSMRWVRRGPWSMRTYGSCAVRAWPGPAAPDVRSCTTHGRALGAHVREAVAHASERSRTPNADKRPRVRSFDDRLAQVVFFFNWTLDRKTALIPPCCSVSAMASCITFFRLPSPIERGPSSRSAAAPTSCGPCSARSPGRTARGGLREGLEPPPRSGSRAPSPDRPG